jgi:orotidine-5'-phosphate decarboxylase
LKNIIVACDFSSQNEAIETIEQLKDKIFGIKVGLQYVTSTGTEGVKSLVKWNVRIM